MNWFNNISFKYKLVFPVLVVAFAFSLLITQVFQSYNEQQQADTLLREQVQPVLDNLEDSYRDMYQVMAAGLGMALTQSDETNSIELHRFNFYDNAPKAAPRISSVHKLVDIGFLPESSRRNIQLLERDFDTWQKRYEIMITDPANAYTFYRENEQLAEKDFESMRKLLKVIRKDIEAHRAELLAKVQDHVEGTKTMLVVGSLLALLLSAVITLVVSRLVVNPLQQLTATLKEISAGEGDLSTRVHVPGDDEVGQLAVAFNTFVEKIHATLGKVVATSHQVRTEATQLTTLTNSILHASQVQQGQYDQVAAAVQELSATSQTVSGHASDAANVTTDISTQSHQVQVTLDESVSAIGQLANEIDQSSGLIQELEKNVGGIALFWK